MTRKTLVGVVVALLAGPQLLAQQTAGNDQAPAGATIVASGSGRLVSGGSETPLPWLETPAGTEVALQPLVARLGGQLTTDPLGASFQLQIGDSTFVLAQDSAVATHGAEIVPLSQAPVVFLGVLHVPLDLIDKTWGQIYGVQPVWDRASHRLSAERPEARTQPVEVSVVHLEGLTTVVLKFPAPPRARIDRTEQGWDVVALGDRFVPPPPRRVDDPYLRAIDVQPDRIRLFTAPEIEAEPYRLRNPDRIVFDLFRASAAQPPAATPPASESARRVIRTVVVDPGHGGSETGAIGPAGTMEKELTLLIARALSERLASELGVRVALTRTDDVDLGLDDRAAFANQNKADLFVSIHLNSAARGDARGAETYFLSLQASDQHAADAAAMENVVGQRPAAPGSDEFDLQLLLWDLAQSQHLAASQRLATLIQDELNRQLDLPDRGVKQAPFRVLMGAAMPAVLVELGFLSTTGDEQRLRDPAYRAELVTALVRAIGRFKTEYEAQGEDGGAAR